MLLPPRKNRVVAENRDSADHFCYSIGGANCIESYLLRRGVLLKICKPSRTKMGTANELHPPPPPQVISCRVKY